MSHELRGGGRKPNDRSVKEGHERDDKIRGRTQFHTAVWNLLASTGGLGRAATAGRTSGVEKLTLEILVVKGGF